VGVPLSKTEVDRDEVIKQLVTSGKRQNFGFLGYRSGENKLTYPKFGRAKAEALYEVLCELADYVIVDCSSNLESDTLASVGIELANQIIRLASPDLKSISFYLSQLPVYGDVKYRLDEHIQGINTPNADVFMPIEEAKSHLNEVAFSLPFCLEVKEQLQQGTVHEAVRDKLFAKRMREIAREVVDYGTH
jgi:MinD-like ATPase involved in chromosome partitioning or flagellar assembly